MAQINVQTERAATYVGIETTYGTTPSMTRAFPITDSVSFEQTQENLPVMDERVSVFDAIKTVQGLQTSTVKLGFNLRPHGTILDASAVTTATHYLGIILKALLGGESAAIGSTEDNSGSSTATSLMVATGDGSKFPEGTILASEVAGALEIARVVTRSTDTLTPHPPFSAAPTNAGKVINSYTYYLTETNTQSLAVQRAYVDDADQQFTFNCLTGSWELKLERGQLVQITASLKGAPWTGPSSQSLSVAAATDPMISPMVERGSLVLVQAATAPTRTHFTLESLAISNAETMEHVKQVGGSLEGTVGVMRTGARPALTIAIKHRCEDDPTDSASAVARYLAQTTLSVMAIVPFGSGTTRRHIVVDIPSCFISSYPKYEQDGKRLLVSYQLTALRDTTTTTGATDLSKSPLRIALL